VYSGWDVQSLRRVLEREEVSVLHLHNPYPLISPAAINAGRSRGVAVVQTVHNHRHVCVAGTLFRDSAVCTECFDRRFGLPAVRHGCYRGSRAQSVPMVAAVGLHRHTFRRVNRFVALTPEIAATIRQLGVRENRIVVKPNTVDDPGEPAPLPERDVLYVGRLSREKGITALLDAWRAFSSPLLGRLVIIGDGPEAPAVEARAREHADVVFRGRVDPREVMDAMRRARLVVIPSLWPEAFPRVAVEALAAGRPVLATRVGGLPDIITDAAGWIVDPSPSGLVDGLRRASGDDVAAKAAAARRRYVTEFEPSRITRALIRVYEDAIDDCAMDACNRSAG
jgi:glycosyltransferase involved in cell wall biosynthesis